MHKNPDLFTKICLAVVFSSVLMVLCGSLKIISFCHTMYLISVITNLLVFVMPSLIVCIFYETGSFIFGNHSFFSNNIDSG